MKPLPEEKGGWLALAKKRLLDLVTNENRRHAWVEKTLRSLPPGTSLLDAGAGERRYQKFCSHLAYVSQDFAQYNGLGDGKGLQVGRWDTSGIDIVSDIAAIPRPDASFDAVLCSEVFEHLPEPLLALKEFSRLLKPGGTLIVTAPFCSLTHFAPYHFYSGFNRYFFDYHLPRLGFDEVRIENNGDYFEFMIQEMFAVPFVARRNGQGAFRFVPAALWILLFLPAFFLLRTMHRFNLNSQEILCFGYHVIAKRNGDKVKSGT